MSFQSKLDESVSLLKRGPESVSNDSFISKYKQYLTDIGVIDEDSFDHIVWEDLIKIGVPQVIARQIVAIFRANRPSKSGHVPATPTSRLSVRQLVEKYNPDIDDTCHQRLKLLSRGCQCVIFNNDSVNVDKTVDIIQEIVDHGPLQLDHMTIDGIPMRVYKIGEKPAKQRMINPLFPKYPLINGSCQFTGFDYSKLDHTTKALLWIAVTTGELEANPGGPYVQLIEILEKAQAGTDLRSRFPKSAILLAERQDSGTVPTLKEYIKSENPGKKNNPFN